MARELNLLEPEFQDKVRKLLKKCEDDGFPMKPFYTLRSVQEQAKLYRQSRSWTEIKMASEMLKDHGAPYLAKVLLDVGPQHGKWATNALPGFSWHQHGEAIDCYWLLDGKSEWSTKKTRKGRGLFDQDLKNGYQNYAEEALKLGMNPGHFWSSKDSVHVQKRKEEVPALIRTGELTYSALDAKMKEMFDV